MPDNALKAVLILEDGSIIRGDGFGAPGVVFGEVVFNTGMVGYPESLTDPSYYGQILVQTWPLVGNYGIAGRGLTDGSGIPLHFESDRVRVAGYAVSRLEAHPSHWSSRASLSEWLEGCGVPGISGIDTRQLTKLLRTKGTMLGQLRVGTAAELERLAESSVSFADPNSTDLVSKVSVTEPREYNAGAGPRIVLVDCGTKFGIHRNLLSRGLSVLQVPYDTPGSKILAMEPAGVVVSNGPGDPRMCAPTIHAVKSVLESDVPTLGICLGTQILALASGGSTYKLKFGHRAQNHPCADLKTGRVYLTTQNHGYSVDPASLDEFDVSFVNLNDNTVEGIRHRRKRVSGVQFHPEASPGPYEAGFLFDEFAESVREYQGTKA